MHIFELASYACQDPTSHKRYFDEELSRYRSEFQRDRDRIIHSTAFRRLQGKTQVFMSPRIDHCRTRLTHSLEVAQIARSMAMRLNVEPDLTETIALAHDLGHPPFGHTGEDELNRLCQKYGGFNHNIHTIRLISKLEEAYADFDGLNLTKASLDGLIKHNGPVKDAVIRDHYMIQDLVDRLDIQLNDHASLEAQIAAIADDIAYLCHDIDDAIRMNVLSFNDIVEVPLIKIILGDIQTGQYGEKAKKLTGKKRIKTLIRGMIEHMINDVVNYTMARIHVLKIQHQHQIAKAGETLVAFSPRFMQYIKELRSFEREKIYNNKIILDDRGYCDIVIRDLFDYFIKNPAYIQNLLGHEKQQVFQCEISKAEYVVDYIAGMTDRFALSLHADLKK